MTDWTSTAFIFPGQGSQSVGMGKDFYEAYPLAKETFEEADSILGYVLSDLCFNGPAETLDLTIHTQPAVFVCSMAILRVLWEHLPDARPTAVAGHSLGEITALCAADVMSFADSVRLVQARGQRMTDAGAQNPGGMAAVLGLDVDIVRGICETAKSTMGAPLIVANDNCPGQLVISGDAIALDHAIPMLEEAGARRIVKLAISIAAHSPLMAVSTEQFSADIAKVTFNQPETAVYGNINARPLADVDSIRTELKDQLTYPVRWRESIENMIADGIQTFIEIGNGDVLSGLVKRIERGVARITLNSVEALQQFVENTNSTQT